MPGKLDTRHHLKALSPALETMKALGYEPAACLAGTELTEADLHHGSAEGVFSLEQEFRFHRNLLALTDNPLLGLLLGKSYQLQSYGLLGYAMMSAPTLRQALVVLNNYGPLTFSPFQIDFAVEGDRGILRQSPDVAVPPDLFNFYVDRDMSAAVNGTASILPMKLQPLQVTLMHDGQGHSEHYRREFGCPVSFRADSSELHVQASDLDAAMPLGDSETSAMCQQQCQMLLARMSAGSTFIDKVRQLMLARPGYFPDIDYVAERLGMTSRTLRRRLTQEDSSYQDILSEVRYQLAREYLSTSTLPLEEISVMLGYSAPGNFSNAFKRWHGCSPRQFRQESH